MLLPTRAQLKALKRKEKSEFMMTWHVYPVNDLREHDVDSGDLCWCKPDIDNFGTVLHRSMDGREDYETGKRKLN